MSDLDKQEWTDGPEDRNEQESAQEFEQALARSLRRVDAPEDFAARVMARAEAEERTAQVVRQNDNAGGWREWFGSGWKPAWGALAAILVAAVLSGHVVHERRAEDQARARVQASRQFDVSVQITDKALDHAREQLRKAGVPVDEDGQ